MTAGQSSGRVSDYRRGNAPARPQADGRANFLTVNRRCLRFSRFIFLVFICKCCLFMPLICVIYILLLKCDALSSDTAFSFAVYYHYITLLFFFVCYICWYNKLLPPFYHYALWIIIFKRVFFYAFYIVFLHIINFILYNAGFTHFLGKKYCKLIGTQIPPKLSTASQNDRYFCPCNYHPQTPADCRFSAYNSLKFRTKSVI